MSAHRYLFLCLQKHEKNFKTCHGGSAPFSSLTRTPSVISQKSVVTSQDYQPQHL